MKSIFADTFQNDMNRIKEVLEEKGVKQTWLAEQLGKSYNMVNGYVQNRQQPRLEVLFEIAKILGVKPQEPFAATSPERDVAISLSSQYEYVRGISQLLAFFTNNI